MNLNIDEDDDEQVNRSSFLTPEQFSESVKLYTEELNNYLDIINSNLKEDNSEKNNSELNDKKNKSIDSVNSKLINEDLTTEPTARAAAAAAETPATSLKLTSNKEKLKVKNYNLYLKSVEKSINFRNRGNDLFNCKKYSDAIVLYNLVSIK